MRFKFTSLPLYSILSILAYFHDIFWALHHCIEPASIHPSLVSPHVEIEARHVCLHISLSYATWCASLQPFHPNLVFISLSTVLLQVSFGLPFFLLPSGFQVNATLTWLLGSLLSMCPIYLQRLSRIVSLTGLVLVRRYSSSFEIFIGHLIFRIFVKHTRWNPSSLSSSVPVTLHSSAPYRYYIA